MVRQRVSRVKVGDTLCIADFFVLKKTFTVCPEFRFDSEIPSNVASPFGETWVCCITGHARVSLTGRLVGASFFETLDCASRGDVNYQTSRKSVVDLEA